MMMSWWKSAKLEDAIGAWAPFAGRGPCPEVDDRFRAEVGSITPEERACMLGYRLACSHGHGDASLVPGPWAAVWAMRHGFPAEWDDGTPPGIQIMSIQEHITGTGRLGWEALGDGSLRIAVWRGPQGGVGPHLVLSAVIRTETPIYASTPEWNDGIDPSRISVRAHASYGRRHLDTMVNAIRMACGWPAEDEIADLEIEGLPSEKFDRVRIADANPEPDPWDPVFRPEPIPAGSKVRFDLGSDYGIATGEATGETPEWGQYERSWGQWVKADNDGNRWFVPVDDIKSVEGGGA